jgi:hypothetical protein
MPPNETQQVQPAFMQAVMHSQQAWHMAAQPSSPLVQVMHTPILVSVHSHLHIDMQHWHIIMPFIMQVHEHIDPANILHMFCNVAAAISSSQVQVILNPPLHFSIFIVQRGTMHMAPDILPGIEPAIGDPIGAEPGMVPIAPRSIIIMLAIEKLLLIGGCRPAWRFFGAGRIPRISAPAADPSTSCAPLDKPVSSANPSSEKPPVARVSTYDEQA